MSLPHIKAAARANAVRVGRMNKGRSRPDASRRMKEHNPMLCEASREKMRKTLTGRPFSGTRGGNGRLTHPQVLLYEALNREACLEYPISTKGVKWPNRLPTCYKPDLAFPKHHAAIEVDGPSHLLQHMKDLDHKKTSVLTLLGWRVLRLTNSEIMSDPKAAAAKVRRFIASK
jgi:hypothetical protein